MSSWAYVVDDGILIYWDGLERSFVTVFLPVALLLAKLSARRALFVKRRPN